jgi:hypothetical protein
VAAVYERAIYVFLTSSIRDDDLRERVDFLAREGFGVLGGQGLHQRHGTGGTGILHDDEEADKP